MLMGDGFTDARVTDAMEGLGSDFLPPERLSVADQMRQMRQRAEELGGQEGPPSPHLEPAHTRSRDLDRESRSKPRDPGRGR